MFWDYFLRFLASFWEAFGSQGEVLDVIWEPSGDLQEVFGSLSRCCVVKRETVKSVVSLQEY